MPTVWRTLPTLDWLISKWTTMSLDPAFTAVSDAIDRGLEKINKWHNVVETNHVYFICLGMQCMSSQLFVVVTVIM